MPDVRAHGNSPYTAAVIHGGPGAVGEMAPVARELSRRSGILEPLQSAETLDGQVEELRAQLEEHAFLPLTLIGYSWGAWLAWITAARYPQLARRLVLVSSPPLDERYAGQIVTTRLRRLSPRERNEWHGLNAALSEPTRSDADTLLARLGELASKADSFDPLPVDYDAADRAAPNGRIYTAVWESAANLRRDGSLMELAADIRCPVTAIHGDHDPHPAEGVRVPLAARLADFRFILLRNCGHTPWREKQARSLFFEVLRREMG